MLERTFLKVEVKESGENREYWASRDWVGADEARVRAADVLVVPWENFREGHPVSFPVGSADFLARLKKSGISAAIAVDREHYVEIMLHAKMHRIPTLIVTGLLLPALAAFLGDEMHGIVSKGGNDDTVQMKVVVEGDHGKCISIEYSGPPGRVVDTLVSEAERCIQIPTRGEEGQDLTPRHLGAPGGHNE